MANDNLDPRQLSRRELIRIAGLGGLTVAAASVAGPLALPRAVSAASTQDDTPEGFLAAAYQQRVQAMTTGDTGGLGALYDPSSATLLAFEKKRAQFFHSGLSARWGGPVFGYTSAVKLLNLTQSGATATARLYETTGVRWIPRPMQLSPVAQALRRQDPDAYRAMLPRGPHGEITSFFGTRHEVTLVKGTSGWRLAKDAYDERHLYAASPDLVPGSWAEVTWGPGPSGIRPNGPRTEPTDQMTALSTYYNRSLAVQCASSNWQTYNYQYCNYDPCGGDCADFASQCFRAGGQTSDGLWYTFNGACGTCGTSATYAGSDTWANNQYLRDWVNANSSPLRGAPVSDASQLKNGDIINYHWPGSCGNDGFQVQHVCIVVDATSGPAVASHDPDLYGWAYYNVTSPCGAAMYYTYSSLYDYYG